jgi:hypothetical protein
VAKKTDGNGGMVSRSEIGVVREEEAEETKEAQWETNDWMPGSDAVNDADATLCYDTNTIGAPRR